MKDEVQKHDACHCHDNTSCSCNTNEHSHNDCKCDEHEPGISCSCGGHDDDDEGEMSLKKILLSLVIFIVALTASHLPPVVELQKSPSLASLGTNIVSLILMVLFLASYLIVGLPVVKNAVRNIFKGKVFDEQFLMALASIGAVFLGEYPEAVAVMLFYQIGEYFQDYAVDKSKKSITELMKIRPDSAAVLRDGMESIVNPETIKIGETIIVKPGERIPLDGIISKGKSFVDTSSQTGESVPKEVFEGKEVMAGCINIQGVIEITVKKVYSESSVARILEFVEHATQNKAKSERFITKFARVYTPAVCLAAAITAFVPPLILHTGFSQWIEKALIFLVVSCPCALVISVPLSFFGGIGSSSRKGILIKGSNYLEVLSKVRTAVFDKTGTLTKGTFIVSAIHPAEKLKLSQEDLIALATHAEFYSSHPISKSLKNAHHCARCDHILLENAEENAAPRV